MSSRAYHSKSRNGCGQCKKRHVKCNFQAPICSNCAKRKQWCDYQLLCTDDSMNQSSKQLSLPSDPCLVPRSSNMTSVSALSLVSPGVLLSLVDDGECRAWDPVIIQETARQAFLQQAFLGLFALFQLQGSKYKSNQDYITACSHSIEASTIFRHAVSVPTETDWVSRLVYAMTVVIFQFRVVATQPDGDCMAETLLVLQSAARFVQSVAPFFIKSRSISHHEPRSHSSPLNSQMLSAIACLDQHLAECDCDVSLKNTYARSIQALKQWVGVTRGRPRTWLHFISWPASLDAAYINQLSQNNPMALVIFLHWCAIMANGPRRWFLDAWAINLARQAFGNLDRHWKSYVDWPSFVFGTEAGSDTVTSSVAGTMSKASFKVDLTDTPQEMNMSVQIPWASLLP